MNNNEFVNKKIRLLNINLIATAIYFGCLIISFILIYDELLGRKNQKQIFKDNDANTLYFINRIIIFCLIFAYLYVDYSNLNLSAKRNLNTGNLKIQVGAGSLSLISAILVLFVAYCNLNNDNFNVSGIENPEV